MIQWNLKVKKRKLPRKTWGTNSPLYWTLHESFLYQSTSKVKKNICSFRLPMNLNWICLTIFSIESLLTQIFLNGNLHSIKCVIGNYLSPKCFIPGKLQVMNVSKVKTDDVSQSESHRQTSCSSLESKHVTFRLVISGCFVAWSFELQLCHRYPIYFRDKVLNRTP